MYTPDQIDDVFRERAKPKDGIPWTFLPKDLSVHTLQAISPWIYVPTDIWQRFRTGTQTHLDRALILHEWIHIQRQEETNRFHWWLAYIANRQFCYQEELAAIKPQFAYLQEHGVIVLPEDQWLHIFAKMLSGYLYLWPVDYNTAYNDLYHLWHQKNERV